MEKESNLSRLREQRGLTQKEVAEELGITRQAVSQWESGRAFPSMEKQIALSRLYGVSVEALYGQGTVKNTEKEPEPPAGNGPEEAPLPAPKTQRKGGGRIILGALLAVYFCFAAGTLLWGKLTSSSAAATGYLIWETIFLVVGLTINPIWRSRKK